MKEKINLVLNMMINILLVVVLCATTYVVITRQDAALKVYVVVSESMAPSLEVGDVIFTWHVSPKHIHVNDIVTYKESNLSITHRVYAKQEEGLITKGDANNVTDGLIKYEQVVGKVIIVLPKIGYLFQYFTAKQIGRFILVLGCIYVLILYKKMSRWNS